MIEEWKDVKEYEGLYEVSNLGRVRNRAGHIMTPQIGWNGERSIKLSKNGMANKHYVGRLVARAFIPNPNNYWRINHKDLNVENDCVDNLEWVETDEQKTDMHQEPKPPFDIKSFPFIQTSRKVNNLQ